MYIYKSIFQLAALFLLIASSVLASPNNSTSVISLKTCKLDIRADQISYHYRLIIYSGNVRFLYGLANVKMDSVVLVKKKDGSCQLVAQPWNGKIEH